MSPNWQRAVLHAMGAREHPIEVTDVEDLLPWYRRITISAPGFLRDRELFPTVWIRLWVPDLERPTVQRQRGYTLVDPDPQTETFGLEFVLHEPAGAASQWARNVRVGDAAEISFTPAKLLPDPTIGTFVLVGDSSAIPGINSLLDYLPAATAARVVLADPHEEAERLLRLRPGVELTRVDDGAELATVLRGLSVDPADTYAWAAGERREMTAVRQAIRKEWGVPRERQHVQAYWIRGRPFG